MDRQRNAQEMPGQADENSRNGLSVLASGQEPESKKRNQLKEVNTMAASIFVEMETGTSAGRVHPHNGYYAGEFTTPRHEPAPAWKAPIPSFDSGLDLPISA
jgi:hypothetical protein